MALQWVKTDEKEKIILPSLSILRWVYLHFRNNVRSQLINIESNNATKAYVQ